MMMNEGRRAQRKSVHMKRGEDTRPKSHSMHQTEESEQIQGGLLIDLQVQGVFTGNSS